MFIPECWDEVEQIIWKEHNFCCILCGKSGDVLHEIIPKSKAPKNWMNPENRVVLCSSCHREVHSFGSKNYKELLQNKRKENMEKLV